MIWNTEELAGKAIPVGTLVGFFGVLASLKDSVSELGWTVVLVLTLIGIAGWNLFIWRSRIKSRIDAETLVNRFSTTDRVISGGTSAVLLILLGVLYCQTRPPVESNGRYSIAVASRLSGFQEEEITSFSTPFTPSPQGGIKYVSRNDALRLETILFYGGLLSQDDLHFDIEHCRDITEDELISSNSERDWQTLQFAGRIIKQLRNDDSTQQPEIVNAQIENDAGLALWVLASIYSDDGPHISAAAKESVIGYFQKCFEEMDTDDNDDRELRSYIASLLTRNLHPTFVFTVSNTTTGHDSAFES